MTVCNASSLVSVQLSMIIRHVPWKWTNKSMMNFWKYSNRHQSTWHKCYAKFVQHRKNWAWKRLSIVRRWCLTKVNRTIFVIGSYFASMWINWNTCATFLALYTTIFWFKRRKYRIRTVCGSMWRLFAHVNSKPSHTHTHTRAFSRPEQKSLKTIYWKYIYKLCINNTYQHSLQPLLLLIHT